MKTPKWMKRTVLDRLFEAGYISEEEWASALAKLDESFIDEIIREMKQEYEKNAKTIDGLKIDKLLRDNDITAPDPDPDEDN